MGFRVHYLEKEAISVREYYFANTFRQALQAFIREMGENYSHPVRIESERGNVMSEKGIFNLLVGLGYSVTFCERCESIVRGYEPAQCQCQYHYSGPSAGPREWVN